MTTENHKQPEERTVNEHIYAWIFLILGVLLMFTKVIAKSITDDKWLEDAIFAVGASLLGIGLSHVITLKTLSNIANNIRQGTDEIKESYKTITEPNLLSKDDEIKNFRHKWNFYDVTRLHKGEKTIWKHEVIDFSHNHSTGILSGTSTNLVRKPNGRKYIVNAAKRDRRLIMTRHCMEENEPTNIAIIPFMGLAHNGLNAGVCFKETYANTNEIVPCILTDSKIDGIKIEEGRIFDEQSIEKLMAYWTSNFHGLFDNNDYWPTPNNISKSAD